MTTLEIDPAIFKVFPQLKVFAFRITNLRKSLSTLHSGPMLASGTMQLKKQVSTTEQLVQLPIIQQWRDAYGSMGVKPSRYRSSFEALARRVVSEKPLATGITAVDFYNAYSIHYQACIGVYDYTKLNGGDISLRMAIPIQDQFSPLGGAPSDFPLSNGLVVYASGTEILCWGMNCRDSVRGALDESTDDALFFAEGVTALHAERAQDALSSMAQMLESQGGIVTKVFMADESSYKFNLVAAS